MAKQSSGAAPQPHARTGTCWCGYITGKFPRQPEAAPTHYRQEPR